MIFGIDIDDSCSRIQGLNAEVRIGSQTDAGFLSRVVEEMGGVDVVIDDGSHRCADVRKSFDILFPLLAQGGFYFVEDLHTSYWPQWQGGLRRPGTSIEFFKSLVDVVNSDSFRASPFRGRRTSNAEDIYSVEFVDSVVLVRKMSRPPAQILYGGIHDADYLAVWNASGADAQARFLSGDQTST